MRIRSDLRARDYLATEGLLDLLRNFDPLYYPRNESIVDNVKDSPPISPDYQDLARIHNLIRTRKCINVLELGSGFSTLVIADALAKNSQDIDRSLTNTKLRRENPFTLTSIDESKKWMELSQSRIPITLAGKINFQLTSVILGEINGKPCTFYLDLPNSGFDLFYIDGPSQYAVLGKDALGFSIANPDRMPMSGDILRIEHFIQPGSLVLFDGRVANARFFKSNMQRSWKMVSKRYSDQTLFIQSEKSLGKHNDRFLSYFGPIAF